MLARSSGVISALALAIGWLGCSGASDDVGVEPETRDAVRPSLASPSTSDAGARSDASASPSTPPPGGGAKDAAAPPSPPTPTGPVPRADLNALSAAERQKIFTALDGFIRNGTIPVKVAANQVMLWESAGAVVTPVSVVRAHHSILHEGERFFTCHRWYVETVEKAIASSLPNGRMPAWKPSNPIPAPFDVLGAPKNGGDCETKGRLDSEDDFGDTCEFAWTNTYVNTKGQTVTRQGLENTQPKVAVPAKYGKGAICTFKSLDALAEDIGASPSDGPTKFHNLVHNTIGGTLQTMDSPAASIFWPWHATIDDIFQNWLDCKLGPPPPPCP